MWSRRRRLKYTRSTRSPSVYTVLKVVPICLWNFEVRWNKKSFVILRGTLIFVSGRSFPKGQHGQIYCLFSPFKCHPNNYIYTVPFEEPPELPLVTCLSPPTHPTPTSLVASVSFDTHLYVLRTFTSSVPLRPRTLTPVHVVSLVASVSFKTHLYVPGTSTPAYVVRHTAG